MENTEIVEKERLDPALVERLNEMIENRIINNERLLAIVNSLEKTGKRQQKKEWKKNTIACEKGLEYRIKSVSGISYEESKKVWGTWSEKEKSLPLNAELTANSIFSSSEYSFRRVYLRGLSVAEMAKKFPGHNWGNHINDNMVNMAGAYLVSLDNPLKNLPPELEKERHPADCFRLDFNLTVELLLTFLRLGRECPEIYFRTTVINGHSDEVCVGIADGKINFISEYKVRAENKMGILLVKSEKWM